MNRWYSELHKKSELGFLIWLGAAVVIANTGWRVIMNNFAVDTIGMTGDTIGILQSLREIPGLLSFTVLFFIMFMKEQTVVIFALCTLGIGVAITGFFPSIYGFYFTTVLMSTGFHYVEAVNTSLSTQMFSKENYTQNIAELRSSDSFFSIIAFLMILVGLNYFNYDYKTLFFISGLVSLLIATYLFSFKNFNINTKEQHKKIILRRKYSLFYILTFLAGARRQIFVVFAGLLMVEKFSYTATDIALLFLTSHFVSIFFAHKIGQLIKKYGEKKILIIENFSLMVIFILYAIVESKNQAAFLYIIDNVVFSFSFALKSYFKKIANEADITSTVSVSFTINHITAVFLPFLLGIIWVYSISYVFYLASLFALLSLLFSFQIPTNEKVTIPVS